MSLDFAECDRARLAREAAYDGLFYTGVLRRCPPDVRLDLDSGHYADKLGSPSGAISGRRLERIAQRSVLR